MKIAIDIGELEKGHGVRGIGFYAKHLIEALGSSVEAVNFRETNLSRYDLIHYPFFDLFRRSLPFIKSTKTVVTIHDVIPLIYPSHYPPGIKGEINFLLQKYSLRKVNAIITDSETSKKDICRFLGITPDKVYVIYLAPGDFFKKEEASKLSVVRNKYKLPEQFALYIGDINYNKNIPTLIEACKIAKIQLVICGKQAKEIEGLVLNHPELRHLRSVDFSKVSRLGFVPDEDLVAIFNLASVYIQPSFYEGFGLPILQAFASGTPVVASKTQALVEIGENAALFANPKNPKDFANKIRNIVSNKILREELVKKGKTVVGKFSWQKTARETLSVYKDILK